MANNTVKLPPRGRSGPISALFMDRAWQLKKDDGEIPRTRIEAVIDRVIDDAEAGNIQAQRLAFKYIQAEGVTEEQAILMALTLPEDKKAEFMKLTVDSYMDRMQKQLIEAHSEKNG